MASPAPGDPAPDIALPAWTPDGETVLRLSDQSGPVVLAFYPGDDTPVCTRQLCSYSDDLGSLQELGATLWGISPQDVASHRRFAERRGLRFPLLADTERAAHGAYGVKGLLGHTKRSVFLVADGVVRWSHVSSVGLSYQGTDVLRRELERHSSSR